MTPVTQLARSAESYSFRRQMGSLEQSFFSIVRVEHTLVLVILLAREEIMVLKSDMWTIKRTLVESISIISLPWSSYGLQWRGEGTF